MAKKLTPSKQKIEAICGCGASRMIRSDYYTSLWKRNGMYRCHKCAVAKASAEGKYKTAQTFEQRSAKSKLMWQNQTVIAKMKQAMVCNQTDEYRKMLRNMVTGRNLEGRNTAIF